MASGVAFIVASSAPAHAQAAKPASPAVTAEQNAIGRGWTLIATGQPDKAAQIAIDLMRSSPRSAAVVALYVEAETARAGAIAGLDAYERWLEGRTSEDGYALRRVAQAALREIARTDAANRREAVALLTADGDAGAAALVAPDAAEVDALLSQVGLPGPGRRNVLLSLGRSGDRRALQPLRQALSDPDPIVRAAAAEALGGLGQPQAAAALKPLLQDPVFTVRVSAALALQALNDDSAKPFLREVANNPHAAIKVIGLRALKDEPGGDWLASIQELATNEDPEVRREAAVLLAPHDPERAAATLKALLNDPNPAIREVAAASYVQAAVGDLATLRRYLREEDRATRTRAAGRILELMRR